MNRIKFCSVGNNSPDEDPEEHVDGVGNDPPKHDDDPPQPETNEPDDTEEKRLLDPQITIHDDSAQSSDRLNRLLYAKAIAQEIENIQPPMTIGILAKWGSGKTQLLMQIKDLLEKKEKGAEWIKKRQINRNKCLVSAFVLILLAICIVFSTLCVVDPCLFISCGNKTIGANETSDSLEQHYSDQGLMRYLALGLLLILILLTSFFIFCKHFLKSCCGPRILCYATCFKIPLINQKMVKGSSSENPDSTSNNKKERYIFVDFNAWEYAGSDNLWAAIVTNLASAIEKEFGVVRSRLFRFTAVKTKQKIEAGKTLKIEFRNLGIDDDVKELMERYGIVEKCERKVFSSDCEFSKSEEMEKAYDYLKREKISTFTTKLEISKDESRKTLKVEFHNLEKKDDENVKKVMETCKIERKYEQKKSSSEWECEFSKSEEMKKAYEDLNRQKISMFTKILEMSINESSKRLTVEFCNLEKDDGESVKELMGRYRNVKNYKKKVCSSEWEREFSKSEEMKKAHEDLHRQKNRTFPQKLKISKDKSSNTLTVKFCNLEKDDDENVKKVMKKCQIERKYEQKKSSSEWEFEFSNNEEMKRAHEDLNIKKNSRLTKKMAISKIEPVIEMGNNKLSSTLQSVDDCVTRCYNFPKKRCGFCKVGCWILFVVLLIAVLISSVFVASNSDLITTKYGEVVPSIIQGILWAPQVIGLTYLTVKLLLSACQSHTSRINKALKGTKINMAEELGFMSKVKYEVELMTEMVRCAEFKLNRKYRVVISIDDLDRLDLDKVKSVLDAVNILLSDKNSPFVCLIAVDSRIAVKSVEKKMSSFQMQSNVTGYEYLKKIINLPFYLPEISDEEKKQFIQGMLTWTDETSIVKKKKKKEKSSAVTHPLTNTNEPTTSTPSNTLLKPIKIEVDTVATKDEITIREKEKFIEECQEFLYNDETTLSYLDGNPRNIKRIFNILSLTLRVIEYIVRQRKGEDFYRKITSTSEDKQSFDESSLFQLTEQTSRDLVTWVILADQWPYSISYILHVIEKSDKNDDRKIEDNFHLSVLYEYVQEELEVLSEEYKDEALIQDRNQEDFLCYLKKLEEGNETKLNKKKVNLLKKITINLDQSYMEIVRRHSSLVTQKKSHS